MERLKKQETIGEEVVNSIIRGIDLVTRDETALRESFAAAIWGGSRGLSPDKLGNNSTSDVDIITILAPHQENDPIHLAALENLNEVFKSSAILFMKRGIVPVVVSTIRLEEAQIAMAEMLHPDKIVFPVHWLFYPSPEFALINEPPWLIRDLVQGNLLSGEKTIQEQIISRARTKDIPTALEPSLGGLDWLTDTFRLLATNTAGQLPLNFLVRQASHNLEYFLKWRVIQATIEKMTTREPKTWYEMSQFRHLFPDNIWLLASQAKLEREKGTMAQPEDILEIFRDTFKAWPQIVSLKARK